jgi:hypothetical protein
VLAVLALATILALMWRADIFTRVLFAWVALGSALGPLLVVRLAGRSISAAGTLTAMLAGFCGTLLLSSMPDAPGDVAERILPFVIALIVAVVASHNTVIHTSRGESR